MLAYKAQWAMETELRDKVEQLLECEARKPSVQFEASAEISCGEGEQWKWMVRTSKRQAGGSGPPLHSELECRIKEKQKCKQRGGLLSRGPTPRSKVALP